MRDALRLALALLATALVLGGGPARAEQWGGIEPGVSTMTTVRTLHGAPTRVTKQKVDGYDTTEWVYEDAKAPGGIRRMIVDFGLLTPKGYQAELVRSLKLEPRPGAFDRGMISVGWGKPDGVGKDGDVEFVFFKEGLFVYFDKNGFTVASMVFTPPQLPPTTAPPKP